MKYIYHTIVLMLIGASTVMAQQEMTLQLMNNVFQSTHTNPAITHKNKVNVTLLSSYHINVINSGFSYQQLLGQVEENESGEKVLNLASVLENMRLDRKNHMNVGTSIDLFAVGFKAGKNRFSLNITEKVQGRFNYHDALLRMVVYGNTPNETFDLSGYTFNAMHYREIGLGYNRRILEDDKLVVGGRLKMLFGLANIQTQQSSLSIKTGSESELYALTANADIQVRTAGLNLLQEDAESYIINTQNKGYGVDLGATYKLDTKISFAASLINVGFIRWKNDVKNYHSQGSFTFQGIDNDSLMTGGDFDFDMTTFTDSIADIFESRENTIAYHTGLPSQMYLTSFYQLARNTTASATLYTDFISSIRKGMAIGIRQNFGKWFQASATYSLQSRAYNNLGMGLALNSGTGGMQLYVVSDNVVGLLNVGSAKITNIRTGFNFVF